MRRGRFAGGPIALLAAAALAAAALSLGDARPARAQVLSPGPLAAAHAKLEGDTHCTECHAGGKRVDDAKCLACHTDIKAQVDASKGMHGTVYKDKGCGPCHVDHIGVNARLVHWPNGDPSKFEHDQTGFPLTGKHVGVDCAKCHTKTTAAGSQTFLGASKSCGSCHAADDVHKGRFGQECGKCHDTSDWKKVTLGKGAFDHSKTRFPLLGAHVTVACKACHGEPAKFTGIAFASCADCHKDPHQGKFKQACSACHTEKSWKDTSKTRGQHPGLSLANGHAKVGCARCHDRGNEKDPSKGTTCVACHANVHEAPFGKQCEKCHADILWQPLPREVSLTAHDQTKYPLKGKHVDVACGSCHDPKKKPDARFRRLVFDRCASCHADKHAGEFVARAGGECATCHDEKGFAPTTFGAELHAATRFPLEARHRAVPCGGCHAAKAPRLDWRNPKRACAECHANPHGDQFAAEMSQGGCGHCHTAAGWGQVKIDHDTFPLVGAHARAACSSCHDPSPEDLRAGKGPTWKGVPRECEGCHADEHAGQFRLEPAKGCADCHDTEAFEIKAYDHAAKTGFALDGKHASLECAKCHATERRKDGVTGVRWRLGYRRCKDCHADPHT